MFGHVFKPLRRIGLIVGIMILLTLTVSSVMAQDASWTVLVYIDGDNNLEGDALIDIKEMEIIGSSDEVNIVVQIDRAEEFSAADGDWTESRRFLIEQNSSENDIVEIINQKFGDLDALTLGTKYIESLGETNNGDTQTLIDFALWGVETYPAEKYALVFWNHGGTWIGGYGGDESTEDHDGMDIPELQHALSTITDTIGQKFEFIGFDTCSMGGYEIFAMLAEYANYGAGSEDLEPGFGWYYTPIVQALVNDPSIDGGTMAETVVTGYISFYDQLFSEGTWYDLSGQPYGQTAVDFSQMDALDTVLSQFASIAIDNMDSDLVSAIGDARNNAQMFMEVESDEADLYASTDLKHFMMLLQRFSSNMEVNAAAQEVIDAIDDFVLSHGATGLDDAHGVSIYFPANQRLYTTSGFNIRYAEEVPYMQDWAIFLETFYGSAVNQTAGNDNSVTISAVVQQNDTVTTLEPPTLIIDTVGTDIVELSFSAILTLDDGTQYMIDNSPLTSSTITEDGEELTNIPDGEASTQYTWGVDMPVITDGENFVDTVLLQTGDDETLVVTGDYIFSNGDEIGASIVFDIETQEAISIWGFSESQTGGQPFEIATESGDIFIPSWRYFDENGDLQLTPSGVELVFGSEPFRYDFFPAESGTYELYVFMTDIAGNVFFDAVELIVDNTGVDTTYRGVADVNFGYNAIYPFDWYGGLDIEDDEGNTRTEYASPDESIVVYYSFYEATTLDDMTPIVDDYLARSSNEFGDPFDIVIGGYDGYEISYYSETDEGEPIYGVIAYTVVPENGIGYLIDYTLFYEPNEDNSDYIYFADLVNTMTFFEPYFDVFATDDSTAGTDIADALAEIDVTVEEFDEFFADSGYTVADLQAEIDDGIYTIEQFREDFIEEDASDDSSTPGTDIEDALAEIDVTIEEFDTFYADSGYSVADLQAEIDEGIYTIEQFIEDFIEEE